MDTTTESVEDKVEEVLDEVAQAIPPKAKSFLGGDWLGHPLHPMLTDLPIGFWTGSFLLDFLGGRKSRRASAAFVGLGVAAAAPTVAAGLVEYQKIGADDDKRDAAVVHTVSNTIGTFFYLWSFLARLRGKRGKGILLGLFGAAAVTVGGYIGGQLAYGKSDEQPTTIESRPGTDRTMRVAV
ncbi:MAG TPA: DUF2231 domain-containing protein [Acidimicrobiales bacterium]|nr:DUF2231 domain-containing protein [Acidimicrobiales bacterium]